MTGLIYIIALFLAVFLSTWGILSLLDARGKRPTAIGIVVLMLAVVGLFLIIIEGF